MKLYASCPLCGYKMFKAEVGSDVEIICPKCKNGIRVLVDAEGVRIVPINSLKKEK